MEISERDFFSKPVTGEEIEELSKAIEDARSEHVKRKAETRRATQLFITERGKFSSKFTALEEAKAKHVQAQEAIAAQRTLLEASTAKVKSQWIATDTSKRRVEYERKKVEETAEQHENKKLLAQEAEEYSQRQNTIAMQAQREAEKERFRLRRSKEVAHSTKIKAQQLNSLLPPLEAPVASLRSEFEPLDEIAVELEEKAMRSRERLAEAVAYEHTLTLRIEDLVWTLPKLKKEQHLGYMHVEDSKRDLQDATERITMEEYQNAFFHRVYQSTAPSPVDGTVAHHVGVQRRHEWEDPWGKRGVGRFVVSAHLDELVYQLERQAVLDGEAELKQVKAEHHDFHQELNTLRAENEDVQKEKNVARQQAEEVSEKLQVAQQALDAATADAEQAQQAAEDAERDLGQQIGISEDADRFADRSLAERSDARMQADLALLKVEDAEEVVAKAQKLLDAATKVFEEQEATLRRLETQQHEDECELKSKEAEEEDVRGQVEVRDAECEWQKAKEAREGHKVEQAQSAERASQRAVDKAVQDKDRIARIKHFAEHVGDFRAGLQTTKDVGRAYVAIAAEGTSKERRATMEQGRAEGAGVGWGLVRGADDMVGVEEGVLTELLEQGQRKIREAARGGWELQQRVADIARVADPARGRSSSLLFTRCARVFSIESDGATLVRANPTSMPIGMKGWVSQFANESGRKFSAVCGTALESGKHTWSVNVLDFQGKGLLFIGIVGWKEGDGGGKDARQQHARRAQAPQERSAEGLKMDLNNYCLGEDDQSWALASDGVKMHEGRAEEYAGVGFEPGDVITCTLDLDRNTLTFSLRGKELGKQLRGVKGPAWPAVSVTRALTAHVVMSDYWRSS